jgi:hypothetical protein
MRTLEILINATFEHQQTQSQAFLVFLADYLNSVGSGIVISACDLDDKFFNWKISLVNNNIALTEKVFSLTNSCIKPSSNWKDKKGRPVQQAVFTCVYFRPNPIRPGTYYPYVDTSINKNNVALHESAKDDFRVCKDVDAARITFPPLK